MPKYQRHHKLYLWLTWAKAHFQYCSYLEDKKQFYFQIFRYDGCWGEKFTLQGLLSIITQMEPARDCKGKLTQSQQFFHTLQSVWFVCCLFRTVGFFFFPTVLTAYHLLQSQSRSHIPSPVCIYSADRTSSLGLKIISYDSLTEVYAHVFEAMIGIKHDKNYFNKIF